MAHLKWRGFECNSVQLFLFAFDIYMVCLLFNNLFLQSIQIFIAYWILIKFLNPLPHGMFYCWPAGEGDHNLALSGGLFMLAAEIWTKIYHSGPYLTI